MSHKDALIPAFEPFELLPGDLMYISQNSLGAIDSRSIFVSERGDIVLGFNKMDWKHHDQCPLILVLRAFVTDMKTPSIFRLG